MKKCIIVKAFLILSLIFLAVLLIESPMLLAADEIKVGILFPITGPISKTGMDYKRSCEFAVDKINAAGGIESLGGAKLKIVEADSQAKPEIGMSETERLIRNGVVAILGAYQSSVTYPTTQLAERAQIPYLVTGAISDTITERGFKYTFRTHAPTSVYAKQALNYVANKLNKDSAEKVKMVGLLYEDTLYGKTTASNAKKFLDEYQLKLAVDIPYPHSAPDISTQITKLKAAQPDLVIQCSYIGDGIQITKKMKQFDFNPKAIFGIGAAHIHPQFISELGPLSNYFFVVKCFNPGLNIPGLKDVIEGYEKRYKETLSEHCIFSISNMYVLKDALERSGSTKGEKLRKAISNTDIKMGEKGIIFAHGIKFGENGENVRSQLIIDQIQNQKRVTVFPDNVAYAKPIFPIPKWGDRK